MNKLQQNHNWIERKKECLDGQCKVTIPSKPKSPPNWTFSLVLMESSRVLITVVICCYFYNPTTLTLFSNLFQDIGIGSYSVCKRCVHRLTGNSFAVKVSQSTPLWHVIWMNGFEFRKIIMYIFIFKCIISTQTPVKFW